MSSMVPAFLFSSPRTPQASNSRRLRVLCTAALATVASITIPGSPLFAQPLSANQAVERALTSNPELQAAVLDIEAARSSLDAAEHSRTPVFVLGAEGQYSERFSSTTNGIAQNSNQGFSTNAGIRYTTPIGTTLSRDTDMSGSWSTVNRDPTSPTALTIGPSYAASMTLNARQPLLRGRGTDAVLAQERIARSNLRATEHGRNETVSTTIQSVLSAYWELWYAEQALGVQRQALVLAERNLSDAEARAQTLGTLSRTDILRFQSEAASARETIADAEANRASRAIALGQLLGMTPAQALSLEASDELPEHASPAALAVLVDRAHRESSALLAAAARLESAETRLRSARNAARPRLDLVASTGMTGLWLDDSLNGLQLPDNRPAFSAGAGLEFEIPAGPSQAEAEVDAARAEVDAAELRIESTRQQIAAQVATARTRLLAAQTRLEPAEQSARIARQLADAETARLAIGTGTSADVVIAEQTYRERHLRYLRLRVDLADADAELSRLTGALLAHLNL